MSVKTNIIRKLLGLSWRTKARTGWKFERALCYSLGNTQVLYVVRTSLHTKIVDVVLYKTNRMIIGYLKLTLSKKIQLPNDILPTDIQRNVAAAIERYK